MKVYILSSNGRNANNSQAKTINPYQPLSTFINPYKPSSILVNPHIRSPISIKISCLPFSEKAFWAASWSILTNPKVSK